MVMQRSLCCFANSRSCGVLDMDPSSGLTTSQSTPARICTVNQPEGHCKRKYIEDEQGHSCEPNAGNVNGFADQEQGNACPSLSGEQYNHQSHGYDSSRMIQGHTCRLAASKACQIHCSFCVAGPCQHSSFSAPVPKILPGTEHPDPSCLEVTFH